MEFSVNQPVLPRPRRCYARYEGVPHLMSILHQRISTVVYSLKHDLLITELEYRFKYQHISSVLWLEKALIKAASDDFKSKVADHKESCYKHDIDLMRNFPMLQDITKNLSSKLPQLVQFVM